MKGVVKGVVKGVEGWGRGLRGGGVGEKVKQWKEGCRD